MMSYNQIFRMNRNFLNKNKPRLVLNRTNRNQSELCCPEGINPGVNAISLMKNPSKNVEEVSNKQNSFNSYSNTVVLQFLEKIVKDTPLRPRSNSINFFGENKVQIRLKKGPKNITIHSKEKNQSIPKKQCKSQSGLQKYFNLKEDQKPKLENQLNQHLDQEAGKWKLQYKTFHKEILSHRSYFLDEGVQCNFTDNQTLTEQRKLINAILQIKSQKQRPLNIQQNVYNVQIDQIQELSIVELTKRVNDEDHLKQQIKLMMQKLKKLHEQVHSKQQSLNILMQKQNGIESELTNKTVLLDSYQNKIKEHAEYMKAVDNSIKQIDNFLQNQPNKILKQQSIQYKEREQQLFDLAFQMEQRTPQCIDNWTYQAILIPKSSFQLTVSTFPSLYQGKNDQYIISREQIQSFKKSISKSFELCLSTVTAELGSKCSKIKEFVRLMRQLASYTIGKRQYLTEINKKMAITYVSVEQFFIKLEKQMDFIKQDAQKNISLSALKELRKLCNSMKGVYHQAEVFY